MFQHQKFSREEAIQAAAVKAVNALIDAGEHHLADALKRLSAILQTMESRRLEHETLEQYNMVTDDSETRRSSVGLPPRASRCRLYGGQHHCRPGAPIIEDAGLVDSVPRAPSNSQNCERRGNPSRRETA
jgi:hypothetical protein